SAFLSIAPLKRLIAPLFPHPATTRAAASTPATSTISCFPIRFPSYFSNVSALATGFEPVFLRQFARLAEHVFAFRDRFFGLGFGLFEAFVAGVEQGFDLLLIPTRNFDRPQLLHFRF